MPTVDRPASASSFLGDRVTAEHRGERVVAPARGRDHDPRLFPEFLVLVEPGPDPVL
jgi:hypothetical protein